MPKTKKRNIETDSNRIHLTLGKTGEQYVIDWLRESGYVILARNFKSKFGEIDIIAQQNNSIAFIEVKTRTTEYFHVSEVVTASKQRKIIATAKQYIVDQDIDRYSYVLRFDIALVQGNYPDYALTYIDNAFTEHEKL